MVDIETNFKEVNKLQEVKDYLLKSSTHFGGSRFTKMMKELSDKEIIACVYERENVLLQRKALRMIDSIKYTRPLDEGKGKDSFEKTRLGYYNVVFCNGDWYIIVDYCGLHYECIEDDPRARKEMEATIEVINQYMKNKEDVRKLVLEYSKKNPQY